MNEFYLKPFSIKLPDPHTHTQKHVISLTQLLLYQLYLKKKPHQLHMAMLLD